MNKHFIKNIKINKFKCFDNFKTEGFSRVNLITGENNVGKTAFMEACFLLSSAFNIFKKYDYTENKGSNKIDRDWFHFELIKLLLEIQQNREQADFILSWLKEELKIGIGNFEIEINKKFKLCLQDNILIPEHFGVRAWGNWGRSDIANFRIHKGYDQIYTKNHLPILKHYVFVSMCSDGQKLNNLIGDLKINKKIKQLNKSLKTMFKIQELDIINNAIMLRKPREKFINLSEFGDGIRHFIKIIIVLLSNKNTTVYLDEIEGGIHYQNFDRLWNIILTISNKQNIQIFATTHSKECIESYARVAIKLEDEEVTLIRLAKLKSGEIKAGIFDYSVLKSAISQEHEVRG